MTSRGFDMFMIDGEFTRFTFKINLPDFDTHINEQNQASPVHDQNELTQF